jgi:hypothetical protein
MEIVVDYNRGMAKGKVFHFRNSLRPFIVASLPDDTDIFVDLHWGLAYTREELTFEGLDFYETEADEDFMGVALIEGFEKLF